MAHVPVELKARLESGATHLCRCWKVVRRDGVTLGFSDHDCDLVFEGTRFAAQSGLDSNALQTSTGLSVDNSQAVGALRSDMVSEEDIRAGLFDDAKITHWLVDWTTPELRVLLFKGTIGEIRREDGVFEAELRGISEGLNKPVGRSILTTCDRVLGDGKCGVDLSDPAFRAEAGLARDCDGPVLALSGLDGFQQGWFDHGHVTWLSGENAGELSTIRAERMAEGPIRVFQLLQTPGRPARAGDRVRLVAGCDKAAGTCRTKFSNLLNFRGFPDIPGEDWVTAYPREGAIHDGASRRNG